MTLGLQFCVTLSQRHLYILTQQIYKPDRGITLPDLELEGRYYCHRFTQSTVRV